MPASVQVGHWVHGYVGRKSHRHGGKHFSFINSNVSAQAGASKHCSFKVQSASVFRSALIPLVGIGVVPLERFYALLLGGNLGTTLMAILAALSADPAKLQE